MRSRWPAGQLHPSRFPRSLLFALAAQFSQVADDQDAPTRRRLFVVDLEGNLGAEHGGVELHSRARAEDDVIVEHGEVHRQDHELVAELEPDAAQLPVAKKRVASASIEDVYAFVSHTSSMTAVRCTGQGRRTLPLSTCGSDQDSRSRRS